MRVLGSNFPPASFVVTQRRRAVSRDMVRLRRPDGLTVNNVMRLFKRRSLKWETLPSWLRVNQSLITAGAAVRQHLGNLVRVHTVRKESNIDSRQQNGKG